MYFVVVEGTEQTTGRNYELAETTSRDGIPGPKQCMLHLDCRHSKIQYHAQNK